jgi:hypothetical protein
MSRGPGTVQRAVAEYFRSQPRDQPADSPYDPASGNPPLWRQADHPWPAWSDIGEVACAVYHDHPADAECEVTRSQIEATRRVIKRLAADGQIELRLMPAVLAGVNSDQRVLVARPTLTAAEREAEAEWDRGKPERDKAIWGR